MTVQDILDYNRKERELRDNCIDMLRKASTPVLLVMRGLPGSGKSYEARVIRSTVPDNFVVLVSRDDIRDLLFGKRIDLNMDDENLVTKQQDHLIRTALDAGRHVIVHDTNLRPKYVSRFITMAREAGAEFYTAEMPVDVAIAIERDSLRSQPVGANVIADMASKYLQKGKYLPLTEPKKEGFSITPYVRNSENLPAAIFDLDGTIAAANGRGWYDHHLVDNDFARLLIVKLANLLHEDGYTILFVSGRSDVCKDITWNWLKKTVPSIVADENTALFMRPEGDNRKDDIIKYEIFDQHIRDNWDVQYVFDDRDSVVKTWRAIGLNTLQVNDGAF